MSPGQCMRLALEAGWEHQGLTYPNPAVGCCIADARGAVLAVGAHRKAGGPHAEVYALLNAYVALSGETEVPALEDAHAIHAWLRANHRGRFAGCTLYVTLEPCAHEGKTPSCASLIAELGLRKVVIAVDDPNEEASGGAAMLSRAGIEVERGFMRAEGEALLLPFLRWREGRFVVFKWAQRLDGTIDGGIVSCEASRRRVHAMRDVCDLLVIGGNTVRTDRPTLDARLVGGRAPDVLIRSAQGGFDSSIPLFGVDGRTVHIAADFEAMRGYRNVMVEGGPAMFESAAEACDLLLAFVSPSSGGTIPFAKRPGRYEILHTQRVGEDMMIWMRGR